MHAGMIGSFLQSKSLLFETCLLEPAQCPSWAVVGFLWILYLGIRRPGASTMVVH